MSNRGDLVPAVVEEYEIGPLPLPTKYTRISRAHWRSPISYSERPYDTQLDSALWDEFICRQLTNVNDILRDVTGRTYSADCADHCLTYRSVMSIMSITSPRLSFILKPLFHFHIYTVLSLSIDYQNIYHRRSGSVAKVVSFSAVFVREYAYLFVKLSACVCPSTGLIKKALSDFDETFGVYGYHGL